MELLIKMYQDKPSRIGIRYIYEYLALRPYEAMIRRHTVRDFTLSFEPVKDKMHVVLTSVESGTKYNYPSLEFKAEHYQKFMNSYTDGNPLEFVHIYPKDNTLVIAKPFRQETFLKITRVNHISAAGY